MEGEIQDKASCPVCLEIPDREIYHCKNGHTVCFTCSQDLQICPQCRAAFENPKMRNRALEDLLDLLKFDCLHKQKGCTSKLSRKAIKSHNNSCLYGGEVIQFCQNLGFTCGFATNTRALPRALLHFRVEHDFAIRRESNIDIHLEGFGNCTSFENRMWTPVVVDLNPEEKRFFVVLCTVNGVDSTLSVMCLEVNDSELETRVTSYPVNFCVDPVNKEEDMEISWISKPIQKKHFASAIKTPILRIPLNHLLMHYVKDNTLVVKCCFEKHIHMLFRFGVQKVEIAFIDPMPSNAIRLPPNNAEEICRSSSSVQSQVSMEGDTVRPEFYKRISKDAGTNAITAWKPSVLRIAPQQDQQNNDEEAFAVESIVKKTRRILNKLTPDNFEKLVNKFVELPLEDKDKRISSVISVVFEKAIDEPFLSTAYARMVNVVCITSAETSRKFREKILDQCQKEFQKSSADEADIKEVELKLAAATDDENREQLKADLEEKIYMSRKRSLGNVRFIGELYKLQMLTPIIMVECVHLLLHVPNEEKLECLCTLLSTVGQKLDRQLPVSLENALARAENPKFVSEPKWMNRIFKRLREFSGNKKYSSRIRFAILDVVELRENGWKPKRETQTPKTIQNNKTSEIVKNIFQEYLANKTFHNTLLWVKQHFPGPKLDDFIKELSRQVAEMPNEVEQKCAGSLVHLLLINKEISKDSVIKLMAEGVMEELPDIMIDSPLATSYLAQFLAEIFFEENNLDWLVQVGDRLLHNEDDKEGAAWRELAIHSLNLLKLKSNEDNVWTLYKNTTREYMIPVEEIPWLQERSIDYLAEQMLEVLSSKVNSGSTDEIQQILREHSWNAREETTARALTEAICRLTWNPETGSFKDDIAKKLLPLLELPNPKMFPNVWKQIDEFSRRNSIDKEIKEHLWNIMYSLNMTTTGSE